MNIEEAIEIMKMWNKAEELVINESTDYDKTVYIQRKEAIETLLTAYEKEKEKNKILGAISLSFDEIQDRDKKWKDKIKAKIEEVNIKLENYGADKINIFSGQTYMEKFKLLGELYGLQSLLEKE